MVESREILLSFLAFLRSRSRPSTPYPHFRELRTRSTMGTISPQVGSDVSNGRTVFQARKTAPWVGGGGGGGALLNVKRQGGTKNHSVLVG